MALVFALLPGVVVAGLLAPDLVTSAPAQEQQTLPAAGSEPEPESGFQSPLLVRRDFSPRGRSNQLLDLRDLFRASPMAPGDLSQLIAFSQDRGELIPFDDPTLALPIPIFQDLLADPVVGRTEVARLAGLLPLGDPLPRSSGLRYDDFPGPGTIAGFSTPIPEPGSGLLLAAGLIWLGARRRR